MNKKGKRILFAFIICFLKVTVHRKTMPLILTLMCITGYKLKQWHTEEDGNKTISTTDFKN